MNYLKILSDNLRKYRVKNNLTIKEMAKITGIPINFLCKIDNLTAKRIKLFYLEKICKTLNTDIKNLFYNE